MSEHRIRLAGPWEQLSGTEWLKIKLPGSVEGSRVVLRRAFNQPSNLSEDERVYCEVPEEFGEIETVMLDDRPVAHSRDRRFDLTAHLQGFHRMTISCFPLATFLSAPTLVMTGPDSPS